jgi:hypothetical protein
MTRPTHIKIAGQDIKVVAMPRNVAQQNRQYGEYSAWDETISIYFKGNPLQVIDTFIHEVLHAVWDVYGLQRKDTEERSVSITATAITQIIRDNPDWVSWALELLYGEDE